MWKNQTPFVAGSPKCRDDVENSTEVSHFGALGW